MCSGSGPKVVPVVSGLGTTLRGGFGEEKVQKGLK